MRVLKKLFSSKNQQLGSIITMSGLALGLWILLLGWQTRFDFQDFNKNSENTFLTINKQVSFLNTMGVKSSFSNEELNDIKKIDGIAQIAPFLGNGFKVRARSSKLGFSTELFFESLPDNFLKELPDDFSWRIGDQTIPIIIPRQYISLYNFGFAPSQGLPQVSPNLIQKFNFEIEIRGAITQAGFDGKIVGVTDQANTILVPQNFLIWANDRFAGNTKASASRIAILCDVDNQGIVKRELESEGFEINSNQLINEKSSLLINLLFLGVMFIGVIILLLAAYLVYQSLQQMVSTNETKINRLFQLGKYPRSILQHFLKISSRTINIGFGLGTIFFLITGSFMKHWIIQQGISLSKYPHWTIYVLIIILFLLLHYSVRKRLKSQIINLFE